VPASQASEHNAALRLGGAPKNILQEFDALQTNSLVLRRSTHQAFQVDLEMLKRVDFLCAAPLASLQDLQHK
jgi:ABC-type transporter Mla MlaB component